MSELIKMQEYKVELETDITTLVETDEIVTEPKLESSWHEIEAEWFESGIELMIF